MLVIHFNEKKGGGLRFSINFQRFFCFVLFCDDAIRTDLICASRSLFVKEQRNKQRPVDQPYHSPRFSLATFSLAMRRCDFNQADEFEKAARYIGITIINKLESKRQAPFVSCSPVTTSSSIIIIVAIAIGYYTTQQSLHNTTFTALYFQP